MERRLTGLFICFVILFSGIRAVSFAAELRQEAVEYKHDNALLEGYLVYDHSISGRRPGILLVHEWTGLNDYIKMRAEKLARLGYVAFAVDMYGKGIRPKDRQEAAKQAGIYRADRQLMRERVRAGLKQLLKNKLVDEKRVAAIGYCFGGGTVLELARSAEDIAGVVSFHGSLDTLRPEDSKEIKAKILVLHGADDPNISHGELAAFEDEMRQAKADWQVVLYGNAVHSFTNPDAGNDPSSGVAYNARADRRSWQEMLLFFEEIFAR